MFLCTILAHAEASHYFLMKAIDVIYVSQFCGSISSVARQIASLNVG